MKRSALRLRAKGASAPWTPKESGARRMRPQAAIAGPVRRLAPKAGPGAHTPPPSCAVRPLCALSRSAGAHSRRSAWGSASRCCGLPSLCFGRPCVAQPHPGRIASAAGSPWVCPRCGFGPGLLRPGGLRRASPALLRVAPPGLFLCSRAPAPAALLVRRWLAPGRAASRFRSRRSSRCSRWLCGC